MHGQAGAERCDPSGHTACYNWEMWTVPVLWERLSTTNLKTHCAQCICKAGTVSLGLPINISKGQERNTKGKWISESGAVPYGMPKEPPPPSFSQLQQKKKRLISAASRSHCYLPQTCTYLLSQPADTQRQISRANTICLLVQPEEGADSTGDVALICSIFIHLPFLISSSGINHPPPPPVCSSFTKSLTHTHK